MQLQQARPTGRDRKLTPEQIALATEYSRGHEQGLADGFLMGFVHGAMCVISLALLGGAFYLLWIMGQS